MWRIGRLQRGNAFLSCGFCLRLAAVQQILGPALAGDTFGKRQIFAGRGEHLVSQDGNIGQTVGVQAGVVGNPVCNPIGISAEQTGSLLPLKLDGGCGSEDEGGTIKTPHQFQPHNRLARPRRRDDVVFVVAIFGTGHYFQDHLLVFAEWVPELQGTEW